MNIVEIINKKRKKKTLTKKEIDYFVKGYCNEEIKDYQMSSLLMAICLNGMNEEETYHLTKAFIESGKKYDLSKIKGIKVDKHSTGGVGDKTSLVVVPLLASLGFKVVKMSGRGLGHTGGTVDKLLSIDGFEIEKNEQQIIEQTNKIGCCIVSQSKEVAYADKKIYALRDVTGTVESIPLIVSSIMSKKIALGCDIICIDVKVGNGAFFKTKAQAMKAAKLMIKIGKRFNVKVKTILSSMDEPLGNNIGNRLEVKEAFDTLLGHGPSDLYEISKEIAKLFLKEAKIYPANANLDKLIEDKFKSKEAYNKLIEMIEYQHGSLPIKEAKMIETDIRASESGYLTRVNAYSLGTLLVELGGGRKYKEQEIDYDVGLRILKKINDQINKGDVILKVYSKTPLDKEFLDKINESFKIGKDKKKNYKSIYAIM